MTLALWLLLAVIIVLLILAASLHSGLPEQVKGKTAREIGEAAWAMQALDTVYYAPKVPGPVMLGDSLSLEPGEITWVTKWPGYLVGIPRYWFTASRDEHDLMRWADDGGAIT